MTEQSGRVGAPNFSARLFAHGGIYGLEQVIQTVVALVLLPVYARYLGTSGYGTIGVLLSMGGVLSIILLQGLGSALFRLRFHPSIRDRLREYHATLVLYLLLSVTVATAVFFLIGPHLSRYVTPNIPFYPWWPWVLLIAASNVFCTLYLNVAQADQRPGRYILFTALRQLSTLGAILFMVVFLRAGALGQIQATALAALVLALASLLLLGPYRSNPQRQSDMRVSFAYGLPVLPHMLAGPLNMLIDRSVVNALLGASLTGVYVAGQQLSHLGDAVAQALNKAYAPLFNLLAQEAEDAGPGSEAHDRNMRAIADMGYVLTLTVLAIGVGLTMISREVLLLLANPEFASAWRIILLLVGAEVMRTYYHVFGRPIHFTLATVRLLPLLSWSAIAVNLAGNFLLIPIFGLVGAALATFISQAALAVFTLILGRRAIRIPYPWRLMGLSLGLFAMTCLALTWCDATLDSLALRLPVKLSVGAPFCLYAMWTVIRRLRMSGLRR